MSGVAIPRECPRGGSADSSRPICCQAQVNRPSAARCHRHTNGRRERRVETSSVVGLFPGSRTTLLEYRGSDVTAFMARFSSFVSADTMAILRYGRISPSENCVTSVTLLRNRLPLRARRRCHREGARDGPEHLLAGYGLAVAEGVGHQGLSATRATGRNRREKPLGERSRGKRMGFSRRSFGEIELLVAHTVLTLGGCLFPHAAAIQAIQNRRQATSPHYVREL
jgi:hypothetical protein